MSPDLYEPQPPISLDPRDPLSSREKSYSRCTRSLTNPHKKFGSPSIAQMSPGYQQVTGNTNSFNNNNSFNNIVNFVTEIDGEGRQILQWLSPLEPQQRHQGVRTDRLDNVGNWVLETSEFRKWRDAGDGCDEQVLFCCGNPGVGKTYVRWEELGSKITQRWLTIGKQQFPNH